MTEQWLDALGQWEAERAAGRRLLGVLQTAPPRQFPNWERWVRGATLTGEWKVRMPPGYFDGPRGGQPLWVPKLVVTDAA